MITQHLLIQIHHWPCSNLAKIILVIQRNTSLTKISLYYIRSIVCGELSNPWQKSGSLDQYLSSLMFHVLLSPPLLQAAMAPKSIENPKTSTSQPFPAIEDLFSSLNGHIKGSNKHESEFDGNWINWEETAVKMSINHWPCSRLKNKHKHKKDSDESEKICYQLDQLYVYTLCD